MTTWFRVLPYIAVLLIGATSAWVWQANSYSKIIAGKEAAIQADFARIAAASAAQALQALEKQQIAEQALGALDKKAQEDKTNALAENDKLRADVASGARRLRIAGSCNTGTGNLSGSSTGTSLGDGGTVELSTAVGSTILSVRAGIIADQAALRALQSYVTNVCR